MKSVLWTEETIKAGFELFIKEHGRLPLGVEIDKAPYLPSSRWIQIKYGGLEKLRLALGFNDTHFGKGVFRSEIAHRVNSRGSAIELDLERLLRAKFGEVFVHTERIFGKRKYRLDFYVYSPDGNFGIDVFFPDTIRTMQSSVNIKTNKYADFTQDLFLVVANEEILQSDMDAYVLAKSHVLPEHVRLISMASLLLVLDSRRSYPDPFK